MYVQKGLIKQIRREEYNILQYEGLIKEWKRLRRKFRREEEANIYLFTDSCPEFYKGKLYIIEVIKKLPDGLVFTVVAPSVKEALEQVKDYLDE